jgi:DNA adenine methylase
MALKATRAELLDSARQGQRYPSPLRYPGGKGKVANYIKLVMLENGLVGSHYVEPYAGGASVALSLLFEEYASHVHINDLNKSVHAFWSAVLNQTDELCERIETTRVSVSEWRRQKAVQDLPDPEELDLAFSTFFLNRTSRSGIIGGGMIGGHKQTGTWKLDARYNRTELVRRIRKIARFRSRITLSRIDAAQYLRNELPAIDGAFVYLDPPYYHKGPGLYENFYEHEDHAEIAKITRSLTAPWIVSYDAVPAIEALYRGARQLRYDLSYSAAKRLYGSEVMFFAEGLRLPGIASAANISRTTVDTVRKENFLRVAITG